MSDNAMFLLAPTVDLEFDGCLLDAFCEDEGFAFAKLEEIEWRSMQSRPVARLFDDPRATGLRAMQETIKDQVTNSR